MGKVTDELLALIAKQVQDHGIVVWYDPECAYSDVAESLSLPETTVLRFGGSFFELRYRIEPFLEFVDQQGRFKADVERPPRLVIYLPLQRRDTQHALVEVEAAGVVMEPGASPWQRNTRLKVLAERVFKRIVPDRAGAIAAEVEAGRRTLAELDWLADQSGDLGAVRLVFETTAPVDVVLGFLCSDKHDEAILAKNALLELTGLFETELGLRVRGDQPIRQVRDQLCRMLLLSELALKLRELGVEVSKLESIELPKADRRREQVFAVCRQWRNRLDLREVYAEMSRKVETQAQVISFGLDAAGLADVETFCCLEAMLLESTEAKLLAGEVDEAIELATKRKASFWSLQEADIQLRWTLLELAGKLLKMADTVDGQLRSAASNAEAIVQAYTEGVPSSGSAQPCPWYWLDRYHRHLEHRYAMLDFQPGGSHSQLESLMSHVRRRYSDIVGRSAECFLETLVADKFEIGSVMSHDEVFHKRVQPSIGDGRTAYFLVDALRFEMAGEVVEGLGDEFEIDVAPCLAQLPSITDVGMAMLMPGTNKGVDLVDVGRGRVGIQMGDSVLKDRASRVKHFESSVEGRTLVLKLNDLMKPSKKRRDAIKEADVLLVTSQEIDRRGEETEDEEESRRFMDEVLDKLRRGIRCLASLGVRHMVLGADHGHLFVEELDDAMKIDAPGGETVDLHPRVWIGRGGSKGSGFVRVAAGELGLGGDLELAFPRGLACFRARGVSGGYFHGGVSLQELVVPVVTIGVREVRGPDLGTTAVTVSLAKAKVTTRFFSVEVEYIVSGLFGDDTKRVRVVGRAGRAEVATAAMAAYGFEEGTQEILLEKDRPNSVTMMLTAEVGFETISVHVLDVVTQVELASVKHVPVEISI